MAWLAAHTGDGESPISTEHLQDFRFEGSPFALMDRQRGIRKPQVLEAALSIRTVYRPEGSSRPYEDSFGDDHLIRYKWRGDDGEHPENRGLRRAMQQRVPLIWFFGVGVALYQPVYPVYVVGEEPAQQQFLLTVDELYGLTKCAICSLGHSQLLDAAHIVPDREELGESSVRNGLALCKIHHSAYDSFLLGVRPDYTVEVQPRILNERDGPMLLHGLQGRHRQKLMVLPSARVERPDPNLLEIQFDQFREAGA